MEVKTGGQNFLYGIFHQQHHEYSKSSGKFISYPPFSVRTAPICTSVLVLKWKEKEVESTVRVNPIFRITPPLEHRT